MYPNVSLGDGLAVAAHKIGTASSTALVTGAIRVRDYDQLMFIFQYGDMANETIDSGVQSVDSDGTSNAANITGKQITQLAASASANDNGCTVVCVKSTDLVASGKEYVRGRIVTGNTTGGTCCITVIGTVRSGLTTERDAATVLEVVK